MYEMNFDSVGGVYYYESEELALKGNKDYKDLIQAIVILEAQKAKAVKDFELLQQLEKNALENPFQFVEQFTDSSRKVNFPSHQKLQAIPSIEWTKYCVGKNPQEFAEVQRRQIKISKMKLEKAEVNSSPQRKIQTEPAHMINWLAEDDEKLKTLLLKFPDEIDETSRWEKISQCLENHTPAEVAKRAYEYYSKLTKEDGEFPGKPPNLDSLSKIWSTSPPKSMEKSRITDTNEVLPEQKKRKTQTFDEEIDPDLHDTPEFQELLLLRRILKKRYHPSDVMQHFGYECCQCKSQPIIGTRWHCTDCEPPGAVNFCEDCVESGYEIGQHTSSHHLEEISLKTSSTIDPDYLSFQGNEYNYLDPNYMPVA